MDRYRGRGRVRDRDRLSEHVLKTT